MMSQTVETLKGEVESRKKLARQLVTEELLLPDPYGKNDDKILFERVNETRAGLEETRRVRG